MQTVATDESVVINKRVYKKGYFKSDYWDTIIDIDIASSTMIEIRMRDKTCGCLTKEDVFELGNLLLELANNMESY